MLRTSGTGQALTHSNNNQTHAAKLLGLSRDALRYPMEKPGLLKSPVD